MIRNNNKLLRKGMIRCQVRSIATTANSLLSESLLRTQSSATASLESCMPKRDTYQSVFAVDSRTACQFRSPSNPLQRTSARQQQQHCCYRLFSAKQQVRSLSGCSQYFENESEYHTMADETLENIQDAVEMAVEDHDIGADNDTANQPEVVYASGVLTMAFPPHGTWVLNKQTPNRQIWWSSPISGPRRYEYDPNTSEWVYTRSSSNEGSSGGGRAVVPETLTNAITEEFQQIYEIDLEL